MTQAIPRDSTPPTNTSLTNDPIHGAIAAHRAAYAAYDEAAEAPDEENDEAFRALDQASQRLMRAEASTLAGLPLSCATWLRCFRRLVRLGCRLRSPSLGAGARPSAHSARTLRTGCRRF